MSIFRRLEDDPFFDSLYQEKEASDRLVQEMSATQFKAHLRFVRYQQVFCEQFSRYAKKAWRELTRLQDVSDELLRAMMESDDYQHEAQLLNEAVAKWSADFKMDAEWLRTTASRTLLARSIAAHRGHGQLRTLDPDVRPQVRRFKNGESDPFVLEMKSEPWARVNITTDIGIKEWRPFEESGSDFQKRILKEVSIQLKRRIDESPARSISKADAVVDRRWVEYFLRIRGNGESKRELVSEEGFHRSSQKNAEDHCIEYLRFAPDQVSET